MTLRLILSLILFWLLQIFLLELSIMLKLDNVPIYFIMGILFGTNIISTIQASYSPYNCRGGNCPIKTKSRLLENSISHKSKLCENVTVSEAEVARDIFYGHYKWERPLLNARKPIDVEIQLILSSVNDLIEREKIIKLTGYLQFYWYDEYHRWNTTYPHACLESVVMPKEDVWIPEIAVINSEQHYALLLMHNEEMVKIFSSGLASYRPGGTFRAYCDFDVTYFPLDEQTCILTMESWRYSSDYQRFYFGDEIHSGYWMENEQWKVTNLSQRVYDVKYVVATNEFSRVEFQISLRRKVGYYLVNIIVPNIIISVAELSTFSLPVDEVMKIHVSFTCLVAYAFFQLMIIQDIPRTSDRIPILCYYIALSMIYICVAMLGEGFVFICVRKAADKRHKQYAPKLVYKAACFLSQLLGIKKPRQLIKDEKYLDALKAAATQPHLHIMEGTQFVSVFGKTSTTDMQRRQHLQQKAKDEMTFHHDEDLLRKHRWEFVSDVFDRVVFVIYLFFIIATPITMFLIVPHVVSTNVVSFTTEGNHFITK